MNRMFPTKLFLLSIGLTVTGVVAMVTKETGSTKPRSFKCILCSDTFTGSSDCVVNPSAELGEISCTTNCYATVYKVFGKIARIDRGCADECEPSDGCPSMGKCTKCCSGHNYCNNGTDFS